MNEHSPGVDSAGRGVEMRLRATEWIKILGLVLTLIVGFGGWTVRLETRLARIESKLEIQNTIIGRVTGLEDRVRDLELEAARREP